MPPMKRKIAITFLLLITLGVAAFFYIHTIFLPIQLRQIISRRAQAFLGRRLTIGKINYTLLKGAVIKDLTIYRKDEEHLPFIHVDEAYFKILIPATLKDKKIVISSLTVKNPYVHLIRAEHGRWNFSDLLNKREKSGATEAVPFILGGITGEQARIEFTNKNIRPSDPIKKDKDIGATKIFAETNLTVSLSFKKGKVQKWKNSALAVSFKDADISLWGYHFHDVALRLEQGEQGFSELNISGYFYDGKFSLISRTNMKQDDLPFKLSVLLKNTNLAEMKKDSRWRKRDISGSLSLDLNLAGPLKKPKRIRGDGTIVIHDGHLWEFNLLKGLWGTLLIPELEDIVFTEASTDFTVENNRAVTKNLSLKSQPVDLLGEGWIDLDRSISFTITPRIKESAILNSRSIKKAPTSLLALLAEDIRIRVSGTLSRPEFRKIILPVQVINRATGAVKDVAGTVIKDVLEEGIKGILKEIFP